MKTILYKKKGRRYIPVCEEAYGFPSEGVFLAMKDGREFTRILKLEDLSPGVDLSHSIALDKTFRKRLEKILSGDGRPYMIHERVTQIVAMLAEEMGK